MKNTSKSSSDTLVDKELLSILNKLPEKSRKRILEMHSRVDALTPNEVCRPCSNSGIDGIRALEIAVATTSETVQLALEASPY